MRLIEIAGQSNADCIRAYVSSIAGWQEMALHQPFEPVPYMEWRADSYASPLWSTRGPFALQPLPGSNYGLIGVEASLGRRLVALGHDVAIVRTAIGSTSLGYHWQPVNGAWPSVAAPLFEQASDHVEAAEAATSATYAGTVWIHGEADAGNAGQAAAYEANLRALIAARRARWPGAWFAIVRLHTANAGNVAAIRAAQEAVATSVSGVRIVDSAGLTLIGAHYDSAGYWELGLRAADVIDGLLAPATVAWPGPRVGVRAGPAVGGWEAT